MQPKPHPLVPGLLLALGSASLAGAQELDQAALRATSASVRAQLEAPLVDAQRPDAVWVRDRGQRVLFEEGVVTFLPAFGPAAAHEWPLAVRVGSASVGDVPLDPAPTGAPRAEAQQVIQPRADFRGVHRLGLEGVEQTFVFDALPSRGELVVRLDVETELTPRAAGSGLRFEHPSLGHVEVGAAKAVDARGRTTPMERRWTGAGIDLVVPADFVAQATLPLTIDPMWSTFASSFGVADDAHPDVVFAGESDRYVVVWEEYTSQQNRDVYATYWDAALQVQGPAIAIDMSSDDWTGPAVAYSAGFDRVLVAASVGLGTNQSRVEGRLVNVDTFTTAGAAFAISSSGGTQKSDVDVGGSNSTLNVQSNFAVVWTRFMGIGDHNVEYRILDAVGQFVTGIVAVDASSHNDIQSTIAPSLGDTALQGDSWTLAWTRDDDSDGRGEIMAKGLYYNGDPAQSTQPLVIRYGDENSHPAASALLDAPHPATGQRYSVIAYETHIPDVSRPGGFQTDIELRPLSDTYVGFSTNVTLMEDGPRSLHQTRPALGTNGRTLWITYLEEEPGMLDADVWDVRMAAGDFGASGLNVYLALGERHVLLGGAPGSESPVRLAMEWEGEETSSSMRGAAVWALELGNAPAGYGRIEGAGVQFILPKTSPYKAVGKQYGDAHANATGESSWLRILGDQDRLTPHLAQARDLPPNQFGMLITSDQFGHVDYPGGSSGRLLLGGTIGRYVNQLSSSGPAGNIDVVIDPLNLPYGGILVPAAVGQTWYFQLWHRDVANGQPTSNFSNACLLPFEQ